MIATLENSPTVRTTDRLRTIRLTARDDRIGVLTFDRPGSSANIFDRATLEELRQELDFIASNAAQFIGLILVSAKRSIFIAGLDLKSIGEYMPHEEIRQIIETGQNLISRVAALPIPTVAAIHGAAMGGRLRNLPRLRLPRGLA